MATTINPSHHPTISIKFDEIVSKIRIPGVSISSGYIEGKTFYFQIFLDVVSLGGQKACSVGRYHFPYEWEMENHQYILKHIRDAVLEAFNEFANQHFEVDVHQPFHPRKLFI